MDLSYQFFMTKNKPHKDKVSILIEFFIKKPVKLDNDGIKREAIAASRLIKRYNDFDFFYDLPELTNCFNSLFGLLMKKNLDLLDKKYKEFVYRKSNAPKIYELSDKPVLDIKIEKQKPRSILEFLKS